MQLVAASVFPWSRYRILLIAVEPTLGRNRLPLFLFTMAPMGPNARAQVPAVSLASQKPEANRYGRVARAAAALILSI